MTEKDERASQDGAGHRARLRQRLAEGGDGLLDHELIEYLLALAIPAATPNRCPGCCCANLAGSAD